MSSIIEGYTYDIFISYRQKDNKHDGWVTEFVDNLKGELEATFKEEISVYFDINPHDGLLETHDVDASLKEKLKCLVFIPIISRTYCDPKSFAWEHEFKAFVEQASKDQFGLRVKLPNGNVANRVLPVRIHELDIGDIKECEALLSGVLRGVEFIYKEPGVDKPLSPLDNEKKNLNNTVYRIQIIKVAHAIREIILGLKTGLVLITRETPRQKESSQQPIVEKKAEILEKPAGLHKKKLLAGGIILTVLLVIAAVLAYPKIFKCDKLDRLKSSDSRISVAIMPFQNMTNDTIWNVWQEGIQDILFTYLSNSPEELKVRQPELINGLISSKGLVNYASMTPSFANTVSEKLDADIVVYGSIKQAGPAIRLNAQLIDSKKGEAIKSFEIEGSDQEDTIFQLTDSLKHMVGTFLIISKLKKELPVISRFAGLTNSVEAYRYFNAGNKFFMNRDFPAARSWYLQAIAADSNFTMAAIYISLSYSNQSLYEEGREWCLRIYEKKDQLPLFAKLSACWLYASYFETPYEEIKYLKQSLEIDDQNAKFYYLLGYKYNELYQYSKAIPEFEKAFEIYDKLGKKPTWVYDYTLLGEALHKTGQFKKERNLYKRAEQDFPDDYLLVRRQAILALSEGKIKDVNKYIEKYKSIRKENSASEAAIASGIGYIYADVGILDKAEIYLREAFQLEPVNPDRINALAYFLIDEDRNIDEGLSLINKALELNPDDYLSIDTQGWGLYKQGKYKEALDLLEKAWAFRPAYDHEIYLHLEAARKAVAGQMIN
jgi:tetratricopeptide (TPR) repeat protein